MLTLPVPSPARWELFRVLSEPVRLRILALAAEEELAIGELAEVLGESQPNVSRHVAPLRQAGLVAFRKDGTRTFVSLKQGVTRDLVVGDAVASGRSLCEGDGSLARIAHVLRTRDSVSREFFAKAPALNGVEFPSEVGAYLAAVGALLPSRALAVDAGTGDGAFVEVLAPVFERVVAIDRSEAQLARAKERLHTRGFANVDLLGGELDSDEVRRAVATGADVVFASRMLHHAPKPGEVVAHLASLARPGGAVIVIDYEPHDDEGMRSQADVWLGFSADKLRRFAKDAGLVDGQVVSLSRAASGAGPDSHLTWQVLVARKPDAAASRDPSRDPSRERPRAQTSGKKPPQQDSVRVAQRGSTSSAALKKGRTKRQKERPS